MFESILSLVDVINNNSGAVVDSRYYGAFGNITYELSAAHGGHILYTSSQTQTIFVPFLLHAVRDHARPHDRRADAA